MVVDHSPEEVLPGRHHRKASIPSFCAALLLGDHGQGAQGSLKWWVNANTSRFGYEHGVYPLKTAIWSGQNDRDDGYGFPSASEPWVPEILVTLLPISAYISIYCWVYRCILISCWFLRSSTFQQYTVPDFCFPSSTERLQAIAITTEFEISKAKTIRKAAGMSKPCCRSCLEISIWSFTTVEAIVNEFWLMIFSHSTTRLNQACVFWACRWIVMDR